MAVRESVVNAIKHGNESDLPKLCSSITAPRPRPSLAKFIVSVRDPGRGFNPEMVKVPLASERAENERARRVPDSPLYRRGVDLRVPPGGMEMRMTKHIPPHA